MRWVAFLFECVTGLLANVGQTPLQPGPDELVLQAAGLSTEEDALLQFFRDRTQTSADLTELLRMARQLGDAGADKRAQAKARLLGSGPWAIPALRHVVNDLENPLAAEYARHCLEWLEGKRGNELPIAAAQLLAARKPAEAAGALLKFLPFAGDPAVVDGVKSCLDNIAARPGKADAALLAALSDALPLRRAVAAEVLAGSGRIEVLPEVRKLLTDTKPQVRLRVARALIQHLDEQAVSTLIDLLAESAPSERRKAEQALHQLAGAWSPTPLLTNEDDLSRKICHEAWAAWWRSVDAPALAAAFRLRTLNETEAVAARALVDQLGSDIFRQRERAAVELVAQGTKVVAMLREASKSRDSDLAQRAGNCLQAIAKNEARDRLPLTAPQLFAIRKPVGAAESLLAFLPFADDRMMAAEIVKVLTILARVESRANESLLKALSDPVSARRIAAAEVLAGAGSAARGAVRKLLSDTNIEVRLRVALALVHAQDKEAVPALIDLVADSPLDNALEADDLLRRLAGDKAPLRPATDDVAARKNFKTAWLDWWRDHGANVDLAALDKAIAHAGVIVIAELGPKGNAGFPAGPGGFPPAGPGGGFPGGKGNGAGPNLPGGAAGLPAMNPPQAAKGGAGAQAKKGAKKGGAALVQPVPGVGTDRLVALDRDGKLRWQIDGLDYPIDFQLLPTGRVLIAEYLAKRVTERDTSGKIVWEVTKLPGAPINVQRLANGNTFIAMYNSAVLGGYVMEVDRAGKTVTSTRVGKGPAGLNVPFAPNEGLLIAAHQTVGGNMIFLFAASASCVRVDSSGKELGRFPIAGINNGVVSREGNLDVTAKGHLLVMQSLNTVTEFDPAGKVIWQVNVPGHRATRLANGNTLVASQTSGVVEVDHAGTVVWQYHPPAGFQAVRAR